MPLFRRNRKQLQPMAMAPALVGAIALAGCVANDPAGLTSLPANLPTLPTARPAWKAFQAGDFESSRELFSRQVKTQPTNAAGHYGLGRVALAQGERDLAITHFTRAIELDDSSADSWAYLGTSQLQLEKNQEAHASLQRSLELDPQHGQALVSMAEYAATVEVDYDKALRHLELAKASGFSAIPPELEPSLRENLN